MYTPPDFAETDSAAILRLVAEYPFATLISTCQGEPQISHLPLFAVAAPPTSDADREPWLFGHFARANPHGQIASGTEVVAVFHGPHVYVSPAWYEEGNDRVVPTWNYQAIHAHGVLHRIDPAETVEVLKTTVDRFEAYRPLNPGDRPWSLDDADPDFIRRLADGIIPFQIRVERWEAKSKLSQNHSVDRQERVIEALRRQGDEQAVAIAQAMQTRLDDRMPGTR